MALADRKRCVDVVFRIAVVRIAVVRIAVVRIVTDVCGYNLCAVDQEGRRSKCHSWQEEHI